MTLRSRIILTAVLIFLFMVFWVSFLNYSIFSASFKSLEKNEAMKAAAAASKVIEYETKNLEIICDILAAKGVNVLIYPLKT